MADNTRTPQPSLPFGTPSRLPTSSAGRKLGSPTEPNAITDVVSLLGKQYKPLTIRGALGADLPKEAMERGAAVSRRFRRPFVLTCQKWIEQQRYILASVNPSDVQWTMAQRSAAQKTYIGEILHVWKNRVRNTFFDEPSIRFTFQSGNIMPIREKPYVPAIRPAYGTTEAVRVQNVNDPDETPRVPGGLQNFYEFLQLVDEQKILDDGSVNYVYIMYNSRIFPNITLAGLFTPEGTSWTDSAQEPNQVGSWSAQFTVYDSFPRLNDYEALVKFFQDAGFAQF